MKNKLCLIAIPLLISSLSGCKSAPSIKITGSNEWGVHGVTTYKASVDEVTWSSSDPSVATISKGGKLTGVKAGSTTIKAEKKGYKSATLNVSIIENPYAPTAADLGVYLGEFNGLQSNLDVQTTVVGVYSGNEVKPYYPTEVKEETFNYTSYVYNEETGEYDPVTLQETYKVLYFGSKFNDGNYRLKFSQEEFKCLQFEKKNGNSYQILDVYYPKFDKYAGTYNGWGDYDDENALYSYSSDFVNYQDIVGGYKVDSYCIDDSSYGETNWLNVTGFYTKRDAQGNTSYSEGFMTLDLTDGEFFEGVLGIKDNSPDLYYIDTDATTPDFFHDPTLFFSKIVDEEGNELDNSWSGDSTAGYTYSFGGTDVTVTASRDENGLKYNFTADSKDYEVRTAKGGFTFSDGTNLSFYSPTFTLLEPEWYEEQIYEDGKGENNFEYWWDFDYGISDDVLISRFNGEDVTVAAKASQYGPATLSFTQNEKEYGFVYLGNKIGMLLTDEEPAYFFDRSFLRSTFNVTLFDGRDFYEFNANTHKLTVNEIERSFEFVINDELRKVVARVGSIDFANGSDGLFLAITPEGYSILLDDEVFDTLEGDYTSNGENLIKIDENKINFLGSDVVFSFLIDASATVYATFTKDNQKYALALFFNGSLGLYSVSGTSMTPVALFVDKSAAEAIMGQYYHYSEAYGMECFAFTSDYELWVDTSDGQGGVTPVQYSWQMSIKDGVTTLGMIYSYEGATAVIPWTYIGYGFASTLLGQGLYIYLDIALHAAQGFYASSDKSTVVVVMDNRIFVCTPGSGPFGFFVDTKEVSITSITSPEAGKYVISGTNGSTTYTFTITVDGDYNVISFKNGEDSYDAVGANLFAALKDGLGFNYGSGEDAKVFSLTRKLLNGHISYQVVDNGGDNYGANQIQVYFDGDQLKAYAAAFSKFDLYIDGDGNRVCTLHS